MIKKIHRAGHKKRVPPIIKSTQKTSRKKIRKKKSAPALSPIQRIIAVIFAGIFIFVCLLSFFIQLFSPLPPVGSHKKPPIEENLSSKSSTPGKAKTRKTVFGKVTSAVGISYFRGAGETNWKSLNPGQNVYQNDTIKTTKYSEVEIKTTNQEITKLMENTVIQIERIREDKKQQPSKISLLSGKIAYKNSSGNPGLEVNSGSTKTTAKNSQFIVDYKNNVTKIAVIEGTIDAASQGKAITIKKNQAALIKTGDSPPAPFDLPESPGAIQLRSH